MSVHRVVTTRWDMVAFGDLFRAALPDTWTNGAWRSMNTPIIVDGVARNNAAVKCVGHHYKLGHEVRVDGNTLTYVTWTLENQEIKKNTVYQSLCIRNIKKHSFLRITRHEVGRNSLLPVHLVAWYGL